MDAEWRLPICNGGVERFVTNCMYYILRIKGLPLSLSLSLTSPAVRMALMQLAVSDAVYLLDMIALPQCLSNSALRAFIHDVFGNSSIIKLGITVTYSW